MARAGTHFGKSVWMIHVKGYGNRGNFYGKGKGGFARYFQARLDLLFPRLSHNRKRQTWNNLDE